MSESWQQVVVEQNPAAMKPADVANLGPPPRDLTPPMHAYIKQAKPSFAGLWIAIAVFSIAGWVMMIVAMGVSTKALTSLWWPALTVGLAVWTGKSAAKRRAALRATLRDGQLRFARLDENLQTLHGKGAAKRSRYHARFDVDGRKVPLVIWNESMGMINRGQLVEVVYNPAYPDEVVPTFLLV